MLRRLPLSLVLALLLLPAAVQAEENGDDRLTLEKIFGRRSFTRGVPSWSWRPGHKTLVRIDRRRVPGAPRNQAPRRVLIERDPLTATETELLDLSAVQALVPKQGPAMRGIGRAGPPTHRWAKDGKRLLVVARGDLVWVDLESGVKRRLTETTSPLADVRVAPDASHVSFSRENELWAVKVDAGKPVQLTTGGSELLRNGTLDWVYPEEFGFSTAAWWAPNGAHVAYLQLDQSAVPQHRLPHVLGNRGEGRQMRYPRAGDPNPRAKVGVVGPTGGGTTWLQLGEYEYVVRVAWTPDSSRVLVVTMDRPQQLLRLHSCSATDGTCTTLLQETDPAWVDAPPAPRFLDASHMLWRSHRDGSTRWYVVTLDAAGTTALATQPITPKGYEASALHHVDLGAKRATFSGTRHGSAATSVYVGWGEGEPKPAAFVTEPEFTTSASLDDSGSLAVVTYSDAVTPNRRELWRTEGELLATIGDASTDRFNAVDLAEPEYLTLPIDEGVIRMRLWKPADLEERAKANPDLKLPVIVHVYGGPGSKMVRNSFGRGPLLISYFTQRDVLVLQVDGRGSSGQGTEFERLVYGKLGVLEIEDQARAVKHLAKRSYVDGNRVGIWGWSYGGTMACNGVTMQPDVFKVAVAVAPVTDWRLYDTIYTERYMNTPQANPTGYKVSAATNHVKAFKGRLLLMHGLGDDNVHVQNTYRLTEALLKARKPGFETMTYPWRGHGIQGASFDVFSRMVEYFERHL